MESNLNILCSICTEFYKESDRVYSTTICGHLFHKKCIDQWLSCYRKCPQCNTPCQLSRIHRVYLNFSEKMADENDIDIPSIWLPLPDHSDSDSESNVAEEEILPENAIKCGTDWDGNDAYIARVEYGDDLLPAMYIPKKGGVYAPYGCKGHFLRNGVQLLIGCECKWVKDQNGHVPPRALATGYSELNENLYTGRAQYEGFTLLGKIHPSHKVIYMAYKGQEVNAKEYEVLVEILNNPSAT